jgi:hypothetical protein
MNHINVHNNGMQIFAHIPKDMHDHCDRVLVSPHPDGLALDFSSDPSHNKVTHLNNNRSVITIPKACADTLVPFNPGSTQVKYRLEGGGKFTLRYVMKLDRCHTSS